MTYHSSKTLAASQSTWSKQAATFAPLESQPLALSSSWLSTSFVFFTALLPPRQPFCPCPWNCSVDWEVLSFDPYSTGIQFAYFSFTPRS